jgi:hypothetical protein
MPGLPPPRHFPTLPIKLAQVPTKEFSLRGFENQYRGLLITDCLRCAIKAVELVSNDLTLETSCADFSFMREVPSMRVEN